MQLRKIVRFRRSPHLVCYWSRGTFVIQNYSSGLPVSGDPIACRILNFFDDWLPLEGLFESMSRFSQSSLRAGVAELVRHSLLERSDRPQTPTEQAMQTWEGWNPAAGFFHFSTKNVRYTTDPAEERRFFQRRSKQWPIPEPIKHYPKAPKFPLPMPPAEAELPQVLFARRTWRQFSKDPIDLSSLGILMRLTWGVQGWIEVPELGRLALKTSPSGGARHPIEVYLLALRVAGLPRGLYHYAADTHQLELVKKGASSGQIASFLPGQEWYGSAGALMLMTAVFARTQWKYRSPRAYRAVLLEAGHLCQTFCIVATWLRLAPFCTLALNDSRVEKHLGLDGVAESVIYAAGVGTRPPGVEWAPEPSAVL
jgi:SagB-type dehydrogenase family enzyme